MFLAMNFFFWPTPSKIGQFEQKWPINWPSGIPAPDRLQARTATDSFSCQALTQRFSTQITPRPVFYHNWVAVEKQPCFVVCFDQFGYYPSINRPFYALIEPNFIHFNFLGTKFSLIWTVFEHLHQLDKKICDPY